MREFSFINMASMLAENRFAGINKLSGNENAGAPWCRPSQMRSYVWSSAFRRSNAAAHPNPLKVELRMRPCQDALSRDFCGRFLF
jgi:hypothetical protein